MQQKPRMSLISCICGNDDLIFSFWISVIDSPALLQSTVKLFFCPTKALDSPTPRQTTLLASEVSFVEEVEEEEEL